jgi:hypothetical protein
MADTATPVSAQGPTGAICPQSGPYRSNRNAQVVIFMTEGTAFPTDADGAATIWAMVTDSG